jgi:hypothetical protein
VLDRERGDQERAEADLLVRLELDDLERVARAPDHERPQRLPDAPEAGRAMDGERPFARAQVERLHHPQQPEPVVEVQVRDEDRVQLRQADGAQQLLLRPLPAVDQDPLAAGA